MNIKGKYKVFSIFSLSFVRFEIENIIIFIIIIIVIIIIIIEEYHAACSPCGTISPQSMRINYKSRRRVDRIMKAKRASQLKAQKKND